MSGENQTEEQKGWSKGDEAAKKIIEAVSLGHMTADQRTGRIMSSEIAKLPADQVDAKLQEQRNKWKKGLKWAAGIATLVGIGVGIKYRGEIGKTIGDMKFEGKMIDHLGLSSKDKLIAKSKMVGGNLAHGAKELGGAMKRDIVDFPASVRRFPGAIVGAAENLKGAVEDTKVYGSAIKKGGEKFGARKALSHLVESYKANR